MTTSSDEGAPFPPAPSPPPEAGRTTLPPSPPTGPAPVRPPPLAPSRRWFKSAAPPWIAAGVLVALVVAGAFYMQPQDAQRPAADSRGGNGGPTATLPTSTGLPTSTTDLPSPPVTLPAVGDAVP